MTFEGSGKFLDSVIQKKEKSPWPCPDNDKQKLINECYKYT